MGLRACVDLRWNVAKDKTPAPAGSNPGQLQTLKQAYMYTVTLYTETITYTVDDTYFSWRLLLS
jgi:hypothetical protein